MRRPWPSSELAQQAIRSPYLMTLIVASLLLSIASFYTTWVGITPFVQYTVFGAFITVGIQALLLVTAWRIGFMFAGKEPLSVVEILVFVVCLTLSVFFSFNSLFNVIFVTERQQEASLGRVRDGSVAAVSQVEQILKRQRDELVKALRESDAYAQWRADILAVADLAQGHAGQLRGVLEAQRAEREREAADAAEAARDLAARKGTLEDEIAAMEQRRKDLEAERPGLAEGLPALRAEVRRLEDAAVRKEAEMGSEEGGIGETGRVGRGPKWAGLKREHDIILAEKQLRENELSLARTRLSDRDQEILALGEEIRKTRLLFENFDAEIEAARSKANEARVRLGAFGARGDLGSAVQSLRDDPGQFEATADLTYLERAEVLCSQLYDNLKALDPQPSGILAHSCDRGPIMGMVSPIRETMHALAELERTCTGRTAPSFHDQAFDAALSAARTCIDRSALPYKQVRAQREELDRLQREEGPNASEFTKTTNALFAGEKLAIFALVIALVMDLLVLFTGLVGAKSAVARVATGVRPIFPRDSEEVIAIKTLLNRAEPFNGKLDRVHYEGKIDIERIADPAHRELLEPMLVRNTVIGMTRKSTKENEPGVYYLRHGAHEQFEEELVKAEARAADDDAGRQRAAGTHPGRPRIQPAGRPVSGYGGLGEIRPYAPGERASRLRTAPGATAAPSALAAASPVRTPTDGPKAGPSTRVGVAAEPEPTPGGGEPGVRRPPVGQGAGSGSDAERCRAAPDSDRLPASLLDVEDDLLQQMLGAGTGAPARQGRSADDDDLSLDLDPDARAEGPRGGSGNEVPESGAQPHRESAQTQDEAERDYRWLMEGEPGNKDRASGRKRR